MTEKHDYKAARDILVSHNKWRRGDDSEPFTDPRELGLAIETAIHALRLAEKVTGEVSDTMLGEGIRAFNRVESDNINDEKGSIEQFKAMIEQAEKETENDK